VIWMEVDEIGVRNSCPENRDPSLSLRNRNQGSRGASRCVAIRSEVQE
jgi:hypothetical protein